MSILLSALPATTKIAANTIDSELPDDKLRDLIDLEFCAHTIRAALRGFKPLTRPQFDALRARIMRLPRSV